MFCELKTELSDLLQNKIIPFWLGRSVDKEHGGYITSFDENGVFDGNGEKNIVTQCRMVWGFSYLQPFARPSDLEAMKAAARQGFEFLTDAFWDSEYGGFFWTLNRDGSVKDPAKLTYGQSFAIYALSQYSLAFHDERALEYAEKCFDLLQIYAADTLYGGYYENMERDWALSPGGEYAGDRKSLDIHMHLMEAFTTLYKASGKGLHRRKLKEAYDIILLRMVNCDKGYGLNQFDAAFRPLPAINILRTWNAERKASQKIAVPTDTTSYGHNVELSWLGDLALKTLGCRTQRDSLILSMLLDHAVAYGLDREYGGIYRDGVADEAPVVTDKEWWQNFESMASFINGYVLYNKQEYLDAFMTVWNFVKKYFVNHEIGESRQLLTRSGEPVVSSLGNPWKGIYHTGRAIAECLIRLESCMERAE